MRISDWSSDVCSSDLLLPDRADGRGGAAHQAAVRPALCRGGGDRRRADDALCAVRRQDRKSVVSGKSVSVRVDLGGRRIIKKKKVKIHIGVQLHNTSTIKTIS